MQVKTKLAVASVPVSRTKRPVLTKRIILDASALLFNEKGYDRTSLDDVARALAVTKPSLYYHFANKQEILSECIDLAHSHLTEQITLHDDPSRSGRDRMVIMLRTYLEVMTENLGVCLVSADERVMSPEGRERYNRIQRTLNNELHGRIAKGVEDGSLKVDNVKLATFAVFGMFNWIGHWHFRRKAMRVDQIFDSFISLVLKGLEG